MASFNGVATPSRNHHGWYSAEARVSAAFADYDGPKMTGRVCGWVNGLFDFEIVRVMDSKQLFFRKLSGWMIHHSKKRLQPL